MEIIKMMFGTSTLSEWIFSLLLSIIGFMLFKRVMYSYRTDKQIFNPYYWWKDNKNEFYIALTLFYVLIRFPSIQYNFNNIFNIPLIEDKYLFIFLFGLLFNIILEKLRKSFKLRLPDYNNGKDRFLKYKTDLTGGGPDPDKEEK